MEKKPRKKDARPKHGAVDPVRIQVAIGIPAIRGFKPTKRLLDEVLEYYAENDEAPPGFTVTAIHWYNPNRVTKTPEWKHATTPAAISEANATLHLRELLQSGRASVSYLRTGKRIRKRK